jgi:hypothetical protein
VPAELRRQDLVGIYRAYINNPQRPPARLSYSTLTLSIDGRFTLRNDPSDESISTPFDAYLHGGSGLWPFWQSDGHVYLAYKISNPHADFSNPVLFVRRSGTKLNLYLTIGDPDSGKGLEYVSDR